MVTKDSQKNTSNPGDERTILEYENLLKETRRYPILKYNRTIMLIGVLFMLCVCIFGSIAFFKKEGLLFGIIISIGSPFVLVLPVLLLLLTTYGWYELSPNYISYKFPGSKLKKINYSEVKEFKVRGTPGTGMDFILKDHNRIKITIGYSTPNVNLILGTIYNHLSHIGKGHILAEFERVMNVKR